MSYYSDFKYGQRNKWFERLYFNRWFKNAVGPILDIGCSTGNFMMVKPEIFEGVEIDEQAIRAAQSRGLNVKKIDVESQLGQLPSEKYEGVCAKQIIEHLNDPLNFLKEIKRILKPGGRAIILTLNCPYMLNKSFWDDYTHKHPYTKKSLMMVAYDAGFKKMKIYEDFRCFPGLGFLMRVFHLSPELVSKIQKAFFIEGLSLIMELEK